MGLSQILLQQHHNCIHKSGFAKILHKPPHHQQQRRQVNNTNNNNNNYKIMGFQKNITKQKRKSCSKEKCIHSFRDTSPNTRITNRS